MTKPRVVDLKGNPVEELPTKFTNMADLVRAMKRAKGSWEVDDDPRVRCIGWRETSSGQRVQIDLLHVRKTATLEQKSQLRTVEGRRAFGRRYSESYT